MSQAEHTDITNPGRRSFLAHALCAGAGLATAKTISEVIEAERATPGPDAELLELGRAFDAAWAEEDRICAELARDFSAEAERITNAAMDVTRGIVRRIEAMAATTLEGVRIKAKAVHWCFCGGEVIFWDIREKPTADLSLAASIVRDLLALAEQGRA